jgi:tryptophan synthase alpha chain
VEIKDLVQAVKQHTDLPVVVGFGISKPEHVKTVTSFADGAVVGSALVDVIAKNADSSDLVKYACEFVKNLKEGAAAAK